MKSSSRVIVLDGSNLTIEDVYRIATDSRYSVSIAPKAKKVVARSRKYLDQESASKIIYGINTGFGPMASHIIGKSQIVELQYNLIRSHAAGMGEPIDHRYVLAAMVVRLNTLLKGYSGVSVELLEQYEVFINQRIIPIVPEHGAVGTSGDLVQLAHIGLALIGEGEVWYRGKRQSTQSVLKRLKIQPYKLKTKEGLALINGTSMMTGIAVFLAIESAHLLNMGTRLGGLALELVHAFDDSVSARLHAVRPHRGQSIVAAILRDLIKSSRLTKTRDSLHQVYEDKDDVHRIPMHVQEVYSLRCMPQVIGPVFDTLVVVWERIETEMNSVTDNPVVDVDERAFLHGGNFHGDYIAMAVDQLKAGVIKLTLLFERQINFFLSDHVNRSFPPFLNLMKPGLTLSLQGMQFVATSTTAHSQSLGFPHYLHSIPTNADNQDIVSMGTDAALIAMKALENAYVVVTIESIVLAQAVNAHAEGSELSSASRDYFKAVRNVFPPVRDDRFMSLQQNRLNEVIRSELFFDIAWFRTALRHSPPRQIL